jgi:DNA modification methylase
VRSKTRSTCHLAYKTRLGQQFLGKAEEVLQSPAFNKYKGKIGLIFTSPPFPLNRKKKYGNLLGSDYIEWFSRFAAIFRYLLAPAGSIVVEMGNSWEPKRPVMSTLAIKSLLAFLEKGNFSLCQQFICYNPARLPSPAQWVTVERIRVKDAFTHIWWMSHVDRPKADNRQVLKPYSSSMKRLLVTGRYNSGKRPSEHNIGKTSFLVNNLGAIPPNVLAITNTKSNDAYQSYCRENNIQIHPARMQAEIPEFFIKLLTEPYDIVLDPFAGSNSTGAVAERLRRRWISIEASEQYVAGSYGRFVSSPRMCLRDMPTRERNN